MEPSLSRGTIFDLQTYRRDSELPGPLYVYIEGDGAAYLDAHTPAADPTPIDPFALRLAASDTGAAVLYLGRPCQFAPGRNDRRCGVRDWTTHRFSIDVIAAIDNAIDLERARSPRRPLVLVGYSGGGVVAALVAARRRDVALLITIAAPLDLAGWTQHMGLSPLNGSDFPVDHAMALSAVPQIHFSGTMDSIVPVNSIRSFIERMEPAAPVRLVAVPGYDHRCCWLRDWTQRREMAWRLASTSPPAPNVR